MACVMEVVVVQAVTYLPSPKVRGCWGGFMSAE